MQYLAFLAALSSTALAQQSLSSTVNVVCATSFSTNPTSSISTTSFQSTTTVTAGRTVVVDPRTTVTAGDATFTTTSTSTTFTTVTAATPTDTFTSYQTVTNTLTITSTKAFTTATTILTTTAVAGATQTIPAPSGFTALGSTPGFTAKKRNALLERREPHLDTRAVSKARLPVIAKSGQAEKVVAPRQNGGGAVQEFPVGVQCTARTTFVATSVSTSTRAGPTTTVTANRATIVRTVTVTASGTQTVIPAETTRFITVSSQTAVTTTTTTTTVTTISNTVTIRAPASTAFAQCQPNNLISSAFGGNRIGTVTFNAAFSLRAVPVTNVDGVQCCAACARLTNCAGYAQSPASQGGACYLIQTDGRCDPTQTFGDTYNYYQIATIGYTVGNSQCGQLGPVAGPPLQN